MAFCSDRYFTTPLGLCGGFLANASVESTHHISQARARMHQSSQGPVFFFTSLFPSVYELPGPGCVQTQWIHLSGQAQCEKSSPEHSQSQSRIKRMKRRGRERMTTVCVQRMSAQAKFDSWKNRPLIETSVRGKCSRSQWPAFNVKPITWCVSMVDNLWLCNTCKCQHLKSWIHSVTERTLSQLNTLCFSGSNWPTPTAVAGSWWLMIADIGKKKNQLNVICQLQFGSL